MTEEKVLILNHKQIDQKITRIAHEIYEYNYKEKELVIIGIYKQGFILAEKLAALLKEISPLEIHLQKLTMDKKKPIKGDYSLDGDTNQLKGKVVILVDDVLNSGRTLIHATRFLLETDIGKLATATLVDRIHRKFPIRADYVGLTLSTNIKEHIDVELDNKENTVYLT
jgi:pyrimidine operon attenuation protein/uracil phosphoribosyltransferase